MLVYLLGKPDGWRVSRTALVNETEGTRAHTRRDGVLAILSELIEAGYITRRAARGDAGKLAGYDYLVSEIPVSPCPDQPDTDQPDTVQPDTANPTLVSTDVKQGMNSTKDRAKATASPKRVSKREQSIAFLVAQGVDPQHAADWMTARKGKEVTMTVWENVQREAAKVGMTPAQAVQYAAGASWQGFNADWFRNSGGAKQHAPSRRDEQRSGSYAALFPNGMPGQAGYGEAPRDDQTIDGDARWIDGGAD
ncbi:hypothetical protein [Burkholderia ubonensis]|uniref:hypothetical protein n=1 Tax=Burkholderia ubonensis TaxID=101571 RepID=UPI0012FB48BF|nr:hypothetical protein [Burkholderia ubonensis]